MGSSPGSSLRPHQGRRVVCKPLLFHFTAHVGAPGRKPVSKASPPVKVCPCAPWPPGAGHPHPHPNSRFPAEALSMGHQQESGTGELPHGSEAVGQKLLAERRPGVRHCAESSVLWSAGGCRDTASAFRGPVVPSGREGIQSKSSTEQCCGDFMEIKFCSSRVL